MTTMATAILNCPNCNTDVKAQILTSTNYGQSTTDLHRLSGGMDPLEYLVHSCQSCGFTGGQHAFEGDVESEVSAEIARKIKPHVEDGHLATDTRWEFAALIAEWSGKSSPEIAQLYLNAAWTARGQDREYFHRRKAADWFEAGLDAGEIQAKEQSTIVYLIGELYRRVGDQDVALYWFDRAIAEAEDPRLRELAEQQKTNPQELISG
jgi:uncharacterized protein (DUF2225 family)